MKYKLEPRKISKKDFYKIDENNLMFITNPGRMGDEDGSTFIIKIDDNYIPYRVDGWMYPNGRNKDIDNYITLEDMYNIFPKWKECWHNKKHNDKYNYIYMGFGNGLCVDKNIYKKYYPYLINEIKNTGTIIDKNGEYEPYLNYSLWSLALTKMITDEKNAKEEH